MYRFIIINGNWQVAEMSVTSNKYRVHGSMWRNFAEVPNECRGPYIPIPIIVPAKPKRSAMPTKRVRPAIAIPTVDQAKDDAQKMKTERRPPWKPKRKEVRQQRDKDCAVVALANILGLDYKTAKMLAFHHGWSSTKGLSPGFLELVLEHQGYELTFRPDLIKGFVGYFQADGVFLVRCLQHVMPSINGRLLNLQGCEDQAIIEVIEVHPAR